MKLPPQSPEPDFQAPIPVRPAKDTVSHCLPPEVSRRLGKRLGELRRQHDSTFLDSKFDAGYLRDVECGKKSISLATLQVIALGMNLTLPELLIDM